MTTELTATYRMQEQIRATGSSVRLTLEPEFRAVIADAADRLISAGSDRFFATGCGTSFHAATHARYLFRAIAGIDVTTIGTSDLVQCPPVELARSPLLVYSHSGVSKATVDAASAARAAVTIAIVNVPGTPLTEIVDRTVVVPGGRDTALAKTRSFTVTMLSNTLLALELGSRTGCLTTTDRNRWEEMLFEMPAAIDEVVSIEDEIREYVRRATDVGYWFFVGSNVNSVMAMEAALKLKETSYVMAEGFETEEAGHGRLQPVDERSMVVALATSPASDQRLIDILEASKAIGARVTVVAPSAETALIPFADDFIRVPKVRDPLLSPLVNVVPAQILACELAVALGYNPDLIRTDQPRYGRANGIVFPPGTH
jgi:glucosamine--fructose-6-phosphate aminotransferase (isomerizing)